MRILLPLLLFLVFAACDGVSDGAPDGAAQGVAEVAQVQVDGDAVEASQEEPSTADGSGAEASEPVVGPPKLRVLEPWTGDLDGMEERRVIRVLTVYGLPRYFLDGPQEQGVTYELFKQFEEFINQRLDKGHLKVHVVLIPVARDELIPGLIEGRGDIAAAGLTITPERDALVDFSDPLTK